MACNLTTGRLDNCTDSIGGLDYVEFADYDSTMATSASYAVGDTDVITDFGVTPTWYKYELNSTANSYIENVNSDMDAGTTFYEQVLSLSLQKLDKTSHKELKLVTYGRPQVRITDRNGNKFLMGLTRGAKVTGGTIGTGGDLAEFTGYTLTMTGREPLPANFLSGSAATV